MASEIYKNIYLIVRSIPTGKVMTYRQIAGLLPGCTARMTGYALAASDRDEDIPWWRVINSQGKISFPLDHIHHQLQKQLLEREGILFSSGGKIDLNIFRL